MGRVADAPSTAFLERYQDSPVQSAAEGGYDVPVLRRSPMAALWLLGRTGAPSRCRTGRRRSAGRRGSRRRTRLRAWTRRRTHLRGWTRRRGSRGGPSPGIVRSLRGGTIRLRGLTWLRRCWPRPGRFGSRPSVLARSGRPSLEGRASRFPVTGRRRGHPSTIGSHWEWLIPAREFPATCCRLRWHHEDRRPRFSRSPLLEPEPRTCRVARAHHHDTIRAVPARGVVVGVIVDDHLEIQACVPVGIPSAVRTETVALIAQEPGILVSAPHIVGDEIEAVVHVFPIGDEPGHVIVHGDVGI